jgi:hypothetical protein
MRKKTSKVDVQKVFRDLGIEPSERRDDLFPPPLSQWPNAGGQVSYRTTLSNGTGKAGRFDAELE